MWLRCKACGGSILLGKCNCGEYTAFGNNLNYDLDNFFKDHAYCEKQLNIKELRKYGKEFAPNKNIPYDQQFEIAYEIED